MKKTNDGVSEKSGYESKGNDLDEPTGKDKMMVHQAHEHMPSGKHGAVGFSHSDINQGHKKVGMASKKDIEAGNSGEYHDAPGKKMDDHPPTEERYGVKKK